LRVHSPACRGFTIVPKFALMPEASEQAIASAVAVRSTSRPRSRALAAAAPKMPSVAVGCQPFS
jgi:hypothetical protein